MDNSSKLFIIVGATASGKKSVAQAIVEKLNAEIISLDSMKVYRGMDIGTAKPNSGEIKKYKYQLIDIVEPSTTYNVAQFIKDCESAIENIRKRSYQPLLVVGTPLYLRSLLYGIFEGPSADASIRERLEKLAQDKGIPFLYERLREVDPAKADKIHSNDLRRIIRALEVYELTGQPISDFQTHFCDGTPKLPPRYPAILVGLKWEREVLYQRIDQRVEQMFENRLVEEVEPLWKNNLLCRQTLQAIAYQEIIQYLEGKITLSDAKELIKKRTHHLARKQMTWFRSFSRWGIPNDFAFGKPKVTSLDSTSASGIQWIDVTSESKIEKIASDVLEKFSIQNKG